MRNIETGTDSRRQMNRVARRAGPGALQVVMMMQKRDAAGHKKHTGKEPSCNSPAHGQTCGLPCPLSVEAADIVHDLGFSTLTRGIVQRLVCCQAPYRGFLCFVRVAHCSSGRPTPPAAKVYLSAAKVYQQDELRGGNKVELSPPHKVGDLRLFASAGARTLHFGAGFLSSRCY